MQALSYPAYTKPSGFELAERARPTITKPRDVLVRVHAASLNFIDVARASGAFKSFGEQLAFPATLGYDGAGIVEQVGADVSSFRAGDHVWIALSEDETHDRGTLAEYVVVPESCLGIKPRQLSFVEAAAMPVVAAAALCSFEAFADLDLAGKTVLITNGLSGVGTMGIQIARRLGAAKIITTVSTAKVELVSSLLGAGAVDQIIDYKKQDPFKVLRRASIDFFLDVTGDGIAARHLIKPGGAIVSLQGLPPTSVMTAMKCRPALPFRVLLDTVDRYYRWQASRVGARYKFVQAVATTADLDRLAKWCDNGKLRPVIGKVVPWNDLAAMQAAADSILSGKGGAPGKIVIQLVA